MPTTELITVSRPGIAPNGGRPGLLVLLHGLGSNEQDLMAFAPMLDPSLTIACIRAPYSMGWGAFAWFEVEFDGPTPRSDEAQVAASREVLIDKLRRLPAELGADPARVTLGGFSQGAMMSLGVALHEPSLISSVLLMSGILMPQFEKEAPATGVSALPFLITHGKLDPLLPISEGRRMRDYLVGLGASPEYHEYAMGHEVNRECLEDIAVWLEGRR